MLKLKIAFFGTKAWEQDYLTSKLKGFDLKFFKGKITSSVLKKIQNINVLSPFIYSEVTAQAIGFLKSLKYISTRSTGFDHIDLAACKDKGILVSNVPFYGDNTVAEHTFALILALTRKICLSYDHTKNGNFSLNGLEGMDLENRTLGVIGVGNIGKHVIRMANGFSMKVIAYDIKENKKLAVKLGFKYVSFNQLLKKSDIVSLHVPYNKHTHHLINLNNLKLFKKGCYLINTSRGGVCDTTALLKGLKQDVFAGLGLDVLEEESFIREEAELLIAQKSSDIQTALENHILINQPNVIITPHNAFNSKSAHLRILDTTIKNILAFSKRKPINLVK